jgi:trimeric autotransporter adhesin
VLLRGAGFVPGGNVTVTVRNVQTDALPRQTFYAVADADGVLSLSFAAEPSRSLGSYEITATDARASVRTPYQVISPDASSLASVGNQLRTYRLAMVSDPAYAAYHMGNTTAAKVALMNRVSQVYEDETSIKLVLIGNNDLLNLDTAAQFSGTNGPCGGTACYPTASVSCSSATLTRTRQVLGLLVGASTFDIGHIVVGAGGGGIASLGVVGGSFKAQGCTGLPTPVGDLFAVDYVAHEMGHQFNGPHTFNGTVGSCAGGNRSAGSSVEPGSGSSIMAYAGICGTNNLQPHSDPYWSQLSFDQVVTYVNAAETNISEVQQAAITSFNTNGQQFQLRFGGNNSAAIVRGTNFDTASIAAAIQGIAGWPAGGTVTVSTLTDTGFTITFGGTLTGTDVATLQFVNCSAPCTGYIGEIAKGGVTTRGGAVSAKPNVAPVVTTTASFTIPIRTPFALTGSATDADGDTVTYMWEQTDRGGTAGTSLISNTKLDGPLFRQFSVRANVSETDTLLYNSPNLNQVTTNPTRVFPDLPQILINNTNAESGTCPLVGTSPTLAELDCFSEYLPTAAYVGFAGVNASPLSLNFKLTARDGRGGVNSATTQLLLATGAGPFLVTSPNGGNTFAGGGQATVTWNVANTNAAPVSTANVKISLSTDGGLTYPIVLATSTPNNGTAQVLMPNLATTTARVKVEAVGNVYFDISNANFSITASVPGDVDGNGVVNCADVAIVRAAFGRTVGQPGYVAAADLNSDGIINIRDLAFVTQRLPAGTVCP